MKAITTFAAIAATALTLSVGTASAMSDEEMISMGHSMLTGSLFNSLKAEGLPTDGVENLTLSETVLLKNLIHGEDGMRSGTAGQVKKILETAAAR